MVNNAIKTIGVIVGSTRPNRVGGQVSQWVERVLKENIDHSTTAIQVVDLQKQNLPFFDEDMPPKAGTPYVHQHTIDWSNTISKLDSFVFVTPEYNGLYPAVLKNSIDYLFKEWTNKPAMVVSYGAYGGKGANASCYSLIGGPIACRMIPQEKTVHLTLKRDFYVPNTNQFVDIDRDLLPSKDGLIAAIEELKKLNAVAPTESN